MSTEHTDEKIYRAYRVALRKQVANRAGARRNQARQIIVDRYNVGFQELKRIVADGDKANGVDHPHSPEYLQKLRFASAASTLSEKHGKVCPHCGTEHEEFVRARVDPESELFDRDPAVFYSCLDCFLDRDSESN